MALNPQHIGSWRDPDVARIGSAHGVRPVLVAKAGATGTRFHVLSASLSVASANAVRLLLGRLVTTPDATFAYQTGAITRAAGSFVDDGWKVGDRLIAAGSTTLANDAETIVTAVAPLTLTVTAGSFSPEALPGTKAGFYRAAQTLLVPIAASAGQAAGTPALDLLDATVWKSLDAAPERSSILGPRGALFVAVTTAIAAGGFLDVLAQGGDY